MTIRPMNMGILLLMGLLLGCARAESLSDPAKTDLEKAIQTWQINEQTQNVLYTYLDDKVTYQTVEKADDVPDPFRNDVIIVDLSRSPEERQSDTKVIVADLNEKPEGHFKLRLEDRAGFELALQMKRRWKLSRPRVDVPKMDPSQLKGLPPPASSEVILYTASWCSYCKKAKAFLKEKKIPFIEKDIEKDPKALEEMRLKCGYARIECNGVPVIDFKGRLIPGFDEGEIENLINQSSPSRNPPPPPPNPGSGPGPGAPLPVRPQGQGI